MSHNSHLLTHCTSCHTLLTTPPSQPCPRCGADNQAWQTWTQAGLWRHLARFFLYTPWGWLALFSLLLPPVSGSIFDFNPHVLAIIVLSASLLLSLAGLIVLFIKREALWTYELTRRFSPQFQAGLLPLGSIGFLAFIVIGGSLVIAWVLAVLRGEIPRFTGSGQGGTMIVIGLVFTGQTLAAGLYSLYVYGQWLAQTFPRPIFLDEARLFQLVERAAKPQIELETEQNEAVTIEVVACLRTAEAGLSLKIRTEAATDKVFENHFLKAVQHWRVSADKWGQVKQCRQEGPLEYAPDPDRVYVPPPPPILSTVVEGELIFPAKPPLPTLEEAIIMAITAAH